MSVKVEDEFKRLLLAGPELPKCEKCGRPAHELLTRARTTVVTLNVDGVTDIKHAELLVCYACVLRSIVNSSYGFFGR